MITVAIGHATREYGSARDVDISWLNEQIRNRRNDTQPVCFHIQVRAPSVDLNLVAGECAAGGGGGRAPNSREAAIIELWRKRQLDEPKIEAGQLGAFLKQVFDLF